MLAMLAAHAARRGYGAGLVLFLGATLFTETYGYQIVSGENIEFFACSQWTTPARVDISCDTTEIIRIRNVTYGKRLDKSIDSGAAFCQTPYSSAGDCFEKYDVTETSVFHNCNFHQSCRFDAAFYTMKTCLDAGFEGERYVTVTYDCLPRQVNSFEILVADIESSFTLSEDLSLREWGSIPVLHLVSKGYPQYSYPDLVICNLGILPDVKVRATVMDVHSIMPAGQCSFEMTLTGGSTFSKYCAGKFFEYDASLHVTQFESHDAQNWTLQFVYRKDPVQSNQGKFWIAIEALRSDSGTLTPGIYRVQCSRQLQLQTPIPTAPTATPTTSGQLMTTISTSNPLPPTRPASISWRDGDNDIELAPLIGGLAAGVFLLIVLVTVIAIVVCRHQYKMHKAPRNLELIDAWSDDKPSRPPSYRNSPEHAFHDPQLDLYDEKSMYTEIPRVTFTGNGSPASRNGHVNHTFDNKHDAYFDGDLYSISTKKKAKSKEPLDGSGKRSPTKENGHVTHVKQEKHRHRRHEDSYHDAKPGELYGYSTTLERF